MPGIVERQVICKLALPGDLAGARPGDDSSFPTDRRAGTVGVQEQPAQVVAPVAAPAGWHDCDADSAGAAAAAAVSVVAAGRLMPQAVVSFFQPERLCMLFDRLCMGEGCLSDRYVTCYALKLVKAP